MMLACMAEARFGHCQRCSLTYHPNVDHLCDEQGRISGGREMTYLTGYPGQRSTQNGTAILSNLVIDAEQFIWVLNRRLPQLPRQLAVSYFQDVDGEFPAVLNHRQRLRIIFNGDGQQGWLKRNLSQPVGRKSIDLPFVRTAHRIKPVGEGT